MADSDKDILITPNTGQTSEPTIEFTGGDNTPLTLRVLDDGTISFEATAGQLFSISDGLSGTIFSVNDISGIPSIEVIDDGTVRLAEYNGGVAIGKSSASTALDVNGTVTASNVTVQGTGIIETLDLNEAQITADLHTINVTSPFLIDSFSSSLYRGAEYTFQLSQNNANFVITKVIIIHNSTDLAITEYGSVEIGDPIPYSFNGSFSLGNMEMTITCSTANTFPVEIKFTRTLIDL